MSPGVFTEVGDKAAVTRQPAGEAETFRAAQTLVSCPVGSIGHEGVATEVLKAAIQSFPFPVAENVFHCGFHSKHSFGAASYLIKRPDGNVLVDSPRWTPQLAKNIDALGGIRYLYLTHKDDVADHAKFHAAFGCERILHSDDVTAATEEVEIKLSGREPFTLADDLLILPVPGHTRGHGVLLHGKFLFTGDHLAWSEEKHHLTAFRDACWYSWPEQTASMKTLVPLSFEWVLPGHGSPHHGTVEEMHRSLEKCIAWMEKS